MDGIDFIKPKNIADENLAFAEMTKIQHYYFSSKKKVIGTNTGGRFLGRIGTNKNWYLYSKTWKIV
ncbi:unnamed protein product, partial [Callosobruchus maculatus]